MCICMMDAGRAVGPWIKFKKKNTPAPMRRVDDDVVEEFAKILDDVMSNVVQTGYQKLSQTR